MEMACYGSLLGFIFFWLWLPILDWVWFKNWNIGFAQVISHKVLIISVYVLSFCDHINFFLLVASKVK